MVPADYKPRRGDIVTILATVQHDFVPKEDSHVFIKVEGGHQSTVIPLDKIVGVKRRLWEEDEEVQHKNNPRIFGRVVATSDESVWVKLGDRSDKKGSSGGHRSFHCNELVARESDAPVIEHEAFPEAESNG